MTSPTLTPTPVPRTRTSRTYTPTDQLQNMRQGFLFAEFRRMGLNTFLTVNFVSWRGRDGWQPGASVRTNGAALWGRLRDMLVNCKRSGGATFPWIS